MWERDGKFINGRAAIAEAIKAMPRNVVLRHVFTNMKVDVVDANNADGRAYYTVYGDGSAQGYDAATRRKLYLRLERREFYALFGDFGPTVGKKGAELYATACGICHDAENKASMVPALHASAGVYLNRFTNNSRSRPFLPFAFHGKP